MAGEYTQEKYNRDVKVHQGIQTGLKMVSLLPGFGIIPGILLNLGTSLFGGIASRSLQKKAESITVPSQNFQQQHFLNQLQEQRRALQTGTANMAQQEAIQQQGALATQNALRASGGDIGTAIWALNRINRSTGRGLNELYSGMSGQAMQMMGLLGQTTQAMANREYQIKGMDRAQKLAEATQARKDFGENLMGTLGKLTSDVDWSSLFNRNTAQPMNINNRNLTNTAPTLGNDNLGITMPEYNRGVGGLNGNYQFGNAVNMGGFGANQTPQLPTLPQVVPDTFMGQQQIGYIPTAQAGLGTITTPTFNTGFGLQQTLFSSIK